jgi:hypothetical protein
MLPPERNPDPSAPLESDVPPPSWSRLNPPGAPGPSRPDGGRIAISTFIDDFEAGRHRTALRVHDLESKRGLDVASGEERLSFEASGQANVTTVLEGDPVWMGGFAWTGDGKQLLYLSPEPGTTPRTWTIRAVDAAGDSPSSALVEGVRSFDVGYAP